MPPPFGNGKGLLRKEDAAGYDCARCDILITGPGTYFFQTATTYSVFIADSSSHTSMEESSAQFLEKVCKSFRCDEESELAYDRPQRLASDGIDSCPGLCSPNWPKAGSSVRGRSH